MLRGERPDPQVLRPVRVLVLVDVEVAPAILVAGEDVGRLVEQPDGLEEEVVEVERADLLQALLVADGELAIVRSWWLTAFSREERRVEHLVLRPADRAEHRARPELAGQRQVLLAEDLLHQALLVLGVVDDEPAADPDRLAVAAQDAGTERVERPGLDVAAGLADEADDPLAELAGGAVRERDREDRPRPDVLDADRGTRSGGRGRGSCREPAPARIRSGPSVVVTARACSGFSRPTISVARRCAFAVSRVACCSASRARRSSAVSSGGTVARQRRVAEPVRLVGIASRRLSGSSANAVPAARGVVGPACRTRFRRVGDSPSHCRSGAFAEASSPAPESARAPDREAPGSGARACVATGAAIAAGHLGATWSAGGASPRPRRRT